MQRRLLILIFLSLFQLFANLIIISLSEDVLVCILGCLHPANLVSILFSYVL